MKRRYYVTTKSNWQGDDWKPVAGPYPTQKVALKAAKGYSYHVDIKSEVHAGVMSRYNLRKYGYPLTDNGELQLLEDINAAVSELKEAN